MVSPQTGPQRVSPHAVTRDITQAGLMRVLGTVAFLPPCVALAQVLANSQNYRLPAVAFVVWLAVLGAAGWLVPRMRTGGLSASETAAAFAIALAAVVAVDLARQPHAVPGSLDLAIIGTIWLLTLVVLNHSARVWVPAALTIFAAHCVVLIRTQGLDRLSLSELQVAGYICVAVLITFAAFRPTLAVHASIAARQSSLASRSAAEGAAADAIGRERRSRLALLEKEALPLLRAIADSTVDPTAAGVRDSCARYAAALRHSLNGQPAGAGELAAALEPVLRAARERGLLVDVQLIGDPGRPPPRLAHALLATVDAVLGVLPPHQATLTVLADVPNSADLDDSDLSNGSLNGIDPEGNDVELYLTFDAPPRAVPDLARSGLDLPAAARWHAAVCMAESSGGYLEVSWRKDGVI
jgi:hypothetical protein